MVGKSASNRATVRRTASETKGGKMVRKGAKNRATAPREHSSRSLLSEQRLFHVTLNDYEHEFGRHYHH